MNIHRIHDLSNSYVVDILHKGLQHSDLENYSPEFSSKNSNIFYILGTEGRYTNGAYFVLEKDGKYIASSGWNKYTDDTALVLTRSFVSEEFRARYLMAEYLLPIMLNETSTFLHTWITCNKETETIYKWFSRANAGKTAAMFNNWPDIYRKFYPIGQREVNYTMQYVVEFDRNCNEY